MVRILLLAKSLFRRGHLPESTDYLMALDVSMRLVVEIAGMMETREELKRAIEQGAAGLPERVQGHAVMLPTIMDLDGKVRGFVLRLDHCRQHLLDLEKLFYGDESSTFEKVKAAALERHGADCPLSDFYENFNTAAKFIRNTRHCVEHRKDGQRIEVRGFSLSPDGRIVRPTIEVVHAETPEPSTDLLNYMDVMIRAFVDGGEALIIHLCEWNCIYHTYLSRSNLWKDSFEVTKQMRSGAETRRWFLPEVIRYQLEGAKEILEVLAAEVEKGFPVGRT